MVAGYQLLGEWRLNEFENESRQAFAIGGSRNVFLERLLLFGVGRVQEALTIDANLLITLGLRKQRKAHFDPLV